jgi:hypothetical protein
MLDTKKKINPCVGHATGQIEEISWKDYSRLLPKAELIYKIMIKEEEPYYTKTNKIAEIIRILL